MGIVLLVLSLEGNVPVEILRLNRWVRGRAISWRISFRSFMLMPLMSVLLFASILFMIASNSDWVIRLNDRRGHSGLSKSSGWRVVGLTEFAIFLPASVKN